MIVQCTNCKARFRVADEKVPDRGVKVRCTKCATVFKVTRADAVDARPAGRDPFGLDTEENPAAARRDRTQRDPLYAEAPPQEEYAPNNRAPTPASGRVVPHMPPTVSLTYGAASPHQSLDLELSLGPPSAPVGVPPSPTFGSTLPPMMMSPPSTRPSPQTMSGSAIDAALDAAMASNDAFGAYDPSPPTPLQFAPMHAPAPQGFGSGSQRRVPTPPGRSAIDPFAAEEQPVDGGTGTEVDPFALDDAPPPPPPPPPPPAPSLPPRQVNLSSVPPKTPPRAADPWVGLLAKPAREETDPFAGLDAPAAASEPAPPAPPPPPSPEPKPPEAARPPVREPASPPSPAGLGAVPASIREIEFSEATQGHKLDLDYGPAGGGGLVEKQEREKEKERDKARDKAARDSTAVELGRIALVPRTIVPEDDRPKADPKSAVKSRIRKATASAVFNVASAALVFYAGLLALAVLRSPRPIGLDDLGFPVVWLALGSGDGAANQLRAIKVHSGIYPMHTGDELFYVEGLAQNDSSHRTDALSVTLEVVRDDHVIEHVDSVAGLQASPEDLYALNVRKNDDLQRLLAQQSPVLAVEPHKAAPFIGIFKLSAKDVEGADIRATVHSGIPPSLKGVVGSAAGGGDADDVAGATGRKTPAAPAVTAPAPGTPPRSPRPAEAAKGT